MRVLISCSAQSDLGMLWKAISGAICMVRPGYWEPPIVSTSAPVNRFRERMRAGGRRIIMHAPVEILDATGPVVCRERKVIRPDRRLAEAAGNIQHVGRLAEPRIAAAQMPHQIPTLR